LKKIENFLSDLLDNLSEYLASRKGMLPLIGVGLVILNLVFEFVFADSFLARTDLFLQLGVIIAIIGFLLARAL
jgi:hypothetical protein